MSKYLLREIKKFRTDSEMEANQLDQHFKSQCDVTTHRIIRKDKKDETYFIVDLVIQVNSEKEPFTTYSL